MFLNNALFELLFFFISVIITTLSKVLTYLHCFYANSKQFVYRVRRWQISISLSKVKSHGWIVHKGYIIFSFYLKANSFNAYILYFVLKFVYSWLTQCFYLTKIEVNQTVHYSAKHFIIPYLCVWERDWRIKKTNRAHKIVNTLNSYGIKSNWRKKKLHEYYLYKWLHYEFFHYNFIFSRKVKGKCVWRYSSRYLPILSTGNYLFQMWYKSFYIFIIMIPGLKFCRFIAV